MGASNAMAVSTYWADLPGDSFKVLAYIALITMDRDPEPSYWGSTDALVGAIGRDADEPTEADYRALRRALKPLVELGALSVDKRAGPGRPPVYGVHLLRSKSDRS